jgi:GntR family transcriptional regulator, arabinose operon transcriptional repressor
MATQTKYNLLKTEIKNWILEGRIVPHQKIGSENELMNSFSVSRHTVRKAIDDLVNEGWIYREHGVGTFCADRHLADKGRDEKNIGIICTYISDYIFPTIIRGAESYLSNKGYTILLASTNNDFEREKQCFHNLLNKNIAGLIVEPTKSALYNPNLAYYLNLERSKIPYLMIHATYAGLNPESITMNDESGGFLAATHLIELGHQKIAGIFKTDDQQGVNRMKGFVRAYQESSLPIYPNMLIAYNTEEKGFKPKDEMRRLLRLEAERPTAVFCYNDEIAIEILDVIREFNLRVPEDISIVGYDDSQFAEASEVKLTTIRHPKAEMGKMAGQFIIDMIEGKQDHSVGKSFVYQPELIVRASTCEPRSRG